MRENAVRNVTYFVVMCAEIRYNPLNVGNCAQKCGKFPRKGRALCGKMREHPSFPQQNVRKNAGIPRSPQWTMRKSAVRIAFSSRQEVPWSGSNPRIVRKSAGPVPWRTMRKSAVKNWVLPGQDVPRRDGILWNVRKSAVKTEILPGQDVPKQDGILWNVRKSAVKTEFLPGQDVLRREGILRTMRKSAVKTVFYWVRTFWDQVEFCELCAKVR